MPHSDKRLLKALSRSPVDRPPFWLMRQAGRYLPEYREIRKSVSGFLELCYTPALAEEVTLQPIQRFGMDAAILFSDILVVPDALGQDVSFREGEGPVLKPVRNVHDLAELTTDRLADHLAPVYETVTRLSKSLPDETALIGFAGAPWTVATYMVEGGSSRDFATVKGWAYGDADGFARLIDLLVDATAQHLAQQVAAGAEVVQLFDTWAGALPEAAFRRWVVDPTAAIVRHLRQSHPDVPVIGFPRGAGPMLEDYVTGTGVDAVSLDTAVPLEWAHDRLQSRCAVQGNLDPIMLVAGGDAMEAEASRILSALSHGPFVFNLGHGVIPPTPPENVARLAEIVRGWQGGR